ncbi:hypothetical protein NC651_027475 [Populus alba x Populus x berolinensis]|nr:hypothetical protein NC651_027475 [Populus alba x Populus x berolinensis]
MLWNFTEDCSLKTLNLYGNQLTGKIPRSLKHCRCLEVVDLGDNQINDTFPFWLGMLPSLQVLILQSNRLHGPIGQPLTSSDFPMLQIFDLSSNHNLFEGEIPEEIGDLKLLEVLNMSRNNLKDLSYNRLEGTIPVGNQFSTFTSDSYQENLGLCGFPLSNKCDDVEDQQPPGAQEESILSEPGSLFSWKFALLGYGCAVPVGVAIGHMLFWRNKRCSKWIEQSFKAKNHRRQSNERNRKRR